MGNLGARLGGTEKEQCRERKEWKRSFVFMKGVCGCGRRSPPILVAVRVNPAKKIHILSLKIVHDYTHTNDSYFALHNAQKTLRSLWATSVRTNSASSTSDRAIQSQTKPPSPRVSKKRDPESRLFTSIILPVCGTPWEPTSTQILGGPLMWRPQPMVKNIEGYPILALGAQKPDNPPACRPNAPHPCPPPPPQRPLGCR